MRGLIETQRFQIFNKKLRRVCYISGVKFYKISNSIYQRHKPFVPTEKYMKELNEKF